jgi:ribosomal protein L11 methyltransferase
MKKQGLLGKDAVFSVNFIAFSAPEVSIDRGDMLKFYAKIPSKESAKSIYDFLIDQELVRWTVETDVVRDTCALRGYVDDEAAGKAEFERIAVACGDIETPSVAPLKKADWVEAYKKSAQPWQCECLYWIPTFMADEIEVPESVVPVYIEPGMAFGTGSHETTQLCGRALVMFKTLYEKTDDLMIKSCMDIGCGSGILGISAIKIGLVHAIMIDIDEDAIRISQENARLNGVFPDQVDFIVGDLKIGLLGRQADVVMANLSTDVLLGNADLLINSVKANGLLCIGGILRSEKMEVSSVFGEFARKRWGNGTMESFIDGNDWTVIVYFYG